MATKKMADFVKIIQETLDKEKTQDPLPHVTSIAGDLKARAEKRIAALEANRKAFNAKIDAAIALERAAIKNIDFQATRIKVPDAKDLKIAVEPKERRKTKPASKRKAPSKPRTRKRT